MLTFNRDMALYWGTWGAEIQSAFEPSKARPGPDSPAESDLEYTYKFFESYDNLPNTKFIHGLNLHRYCSYYSKVGLKAGLSTAMKYMNNVVAFELGNEPEAYEHACIPSDAAPGTKGAAWNRQKYVEEWQNISQSLAEVLPKEKLKLIGPSMANSGSGFDAWGAYQNGIDKGSLVKEFAGHRQA